MNQHLSDAQMASWLAGERSDELSRHLSECHCCHRQIQEMENLLSGFRTDVREQSERGFRLFQQHSFDSPKFGLRRPWEWATAFACLLLALGAFGWQHSTRKASLQRSDDAAMLAQLDQQLSRTVPSSMEPLTQLVSWNDTATTPSESNR